MAVSATMEPMTYEEVLRPLDRPWTFEDLEKLPDDGLRYEIVDGSLHVSPPPMFLHQLVSTEILWPLQASVPSGMRVIAGNVGVHVQRGATQYLIPDALVIREEVLARAPRNLDPADVVLVVEVVSPSSVTHDRITKRALYARMGIEHYWILEHVPEVRVTALRLKGDEYVEQAVGRGGTVLELTEPFPVTLRLAELTG
ncbi:MAG TPA: Uma2 family endonuclease [Mycobacteriales bacterium]|nr:Uma2 family endonuclease [Mycobacteriales bacterium]